MIKTIAEIWSALPFQVKTIIAAVLFGLLVVAIVIGRVGACRSRREEQRIERIQANIRTAETEANVLTNIQTEVHTNANNANRDLDRILNTDSRNRNSDFGTVRRRWCEDHANDSKCRQ